jgi:hypothetical protein
LVVPTSLPCCMSNVVERSDLSPPPLLQHLVDCSDSFASYYDDLVVVERIEMSSPSTSALCISVVVPPAPSPLQV